MPLGKFKFHRSNLRLRRTGATTAAPRYIILSMQKFPSNMLLSYVTTKLKVLLQFKIIHNSITFSLIKSNQLQPGDEEGLRIKFEAIVLLIFV
jgi:hypothetical protein